MTDLIIPSEMPNHAIAVLCRAPPVPKCTSGARAPSCFAPRASAPSQAGRIRELKAASSNPVTPSLSPLAIHSRSPRVIGKSTRLLSRTSHVRRIAPMQVKKPSVPRICRPQNFTLMIRQQTMTPPLVVSSGTLCPLDRVRVAGQQLVNPMLLRPSGRTVASFCMH